ncbi:MAG: UvrD-helicase domain-containing protein [Planctomycetes bacterium]|nr:UvrD-helicase domain-containing protein [Planctomycetota bacterium]
MRFLSGLNANQLEAVRTHAGSILILAGAGTGKTRTIVSRIAALIAAGNSPENILAVTFTNKAAKEMKERVRHILGERDRSLARELTVCTFHKLSLTMLREDAERLGYTRDFTIYDVGDQRSVLRKVTKEVRLPGETLDPEKIQGRISFVKNRGLSPEGMIAEAEDDFDFAVAQCYKRYQAYLRSYNAMDFDDLLLLSLDLVAKHPDLKTKYQMRYKHVLVDEYQDSNKLQFEFIRELYPADAGKERSLCVVGDDDQSIYGFRGAVSKNILDFEKHFRGTKIIVLDQNYRSTNHILRIANASISGNIARKEKKLWSGLGEGELPEVWVFEDEVHEAQSIVEHILAEKACTGRQLGDFAILLRTNHQTRPFEEKLRFEKVPFVLIGGTKFYDRREVRDVVAYLKLIVNRKSDQSFLRVVNTPHRGIGKVAIEKLTRSAARNKKCLMDQIADLGAVEGITSAARKSLEGFRGMMQSFAEKFSSASVSECTRELLEAIDYRSHVADECRTPEEASKKNLVVDEIVESMQSFEKQPGSRKSLRDYLEDASLLEDFDDGAKDLRSDHVTIITLHSAKGLEFPVVYMAGLEEDIFPHKRSLGECEDSEDEERRLFYVGLTRARESLKLTLARKRARYGRESLRTPSRFITELPEQLYSKTFGMRDSNPADDRQQQMYSKLLEDIKAKRR